MEPVRLGSVGLGWWGGNLARTARDSGSAQVVACFDLVPEGANTFGSLRFSEIIVEEDTQVFLHL